jgi:hypothetical protein
MLAPWVAEELKDVNLDDKRLNDRMAEVLDQLGGHPNASIPAACNGWAETVAAYRFFDNKKVSFDKLLAPHVEATYQRIKEHSVVILAQDTTEIDLTRPEREVVGAGPLDDGSRRGALLHPLMGFTTDGTPLGTVYAKAWVRDEAPAVPRTKQEKEYDRKHTPIEEKESVRWVDTLAQAQKVAEHAPASQCVCVSDSEADIYEVLELGQRSSVDWIVRACQDRALETPENLEETAPEPPNHLRQRVLSTKCLFTNEIHVRGRKPKIPIDKRKRKQPRQSRDVTVEVRATTVEIHAPWRHDRKLKNISVNVVLVTEVDPPDGDVPVQWMLLTSLPIDTLEQVRAVIQYYTVRWMIEVYFRTLKSSCRVEERQFETIDRALNSLAIYMIVAWRALMVCRTARDYPDQSCELIFEPEEWKAVYYVVHQQPPPDEPPTLKAMARMIGQLGGYVDRVRKDEPGPQTIAMGLQRAHDIARCWILFGPETRNQQTCV